MSEGNEEPKIIVDEDWKTQVEREKAEAAAKQQAAASEAEAAAPEAAGDASEPAGAAESSGTAQAAESVPPSEAAPQSAPPSEAGEAGEAGGRELPEASISSMVTLFFTQAMMMLGQFPDPSGGKPQIDKPVAKHYIDTLEVLQEKTQGNLTEEEEKMLNEAVHAVRMAFLAS